jgi:hypothetical protein
MLEGCKMLITYKRDKTVALLRKKTEAAVIITIYSPQ